MSHEFRVIQHCPCPKNIAPYVAICLNDAHASVDSIYRGDDARQILNKYGHHSQSQLYYATQSERVLWGILGQPDRPGQSTHELCSDGVAYPVPVGRPLPWWGQGFDVPDSETDAVIRAAARYGWHLFRPYTSGREFHHLNFRSRPYPTPTTMFRIIRLRNTLPRD